jgi:hypothetical protein
VKPVRWFDVPAIRLAAGLFAVFGTAGWLLFFALFRRAFAQDLMVFHTAGRLALSGDWGLLRDGQAFTDLLNRTHAGWLGAPLVLHPWVYPPPTLLLAAPLGLLPFGLAYAAFMGASVAVLTWCLWRWWRGTPSRPLWLIMVALCPAAAFCLGAGQLALLIAAAFLVGLLLLPSAELAAGSLFGLLLLKPQFGLMVPVALLAGRYWRGIAGAALTVCLLLLLSVLAFGLQPWRDWLHLMFSGDPALSAWMATGRHFGQSVDTCARLLGAPPRLASALQLLAIAFSAACVWHIFSRPTALPQRAVALLCAAVLAAPHVGDYDAVLLGIASVITLAEGLKRRLRLSETLLAMAAWLGSLINPPALIAMVGVPLLTAASLATPLVTAGLMASAVKLPSAPNASPAVRGRGKAPGPRIFQEGGLGSEGASRAQRVPPDQP